MEHLVLIRWKPDIADSDKSDVLHKLLALKEVIPGILNYQLGHNVSERSQGFDAAISSTFADAASLAAYGPHPEHQKVAGRLRELADNVLVVDFAPIS